MIKITNVDEFNKEITKGITLIDFFADWCGPCKMISPILEELEGEESINLIKVNVDDLPQIASEYKVFSIPTLVLYKDGKLVSKKIGFQTLDALKEWVKNA